MNLRTRDGEIQKKREAFVDALARRENDSGQGIADEAWRVGCALVSALEAEPKPDPKVYQCPDCNKWFEKQRIVRESGQDTSGSEP